MIKSFLFSLILTSLCYAQPQIAVKINRLDNLAHNEPASVCQGEVVELTSSFNKPRITQSNWQINGQNFYNSTYYRLDTLDLMGAVEILSEYVYKEKRRSDGCEVECHAWSKMLLNITPCRKICPEQPIIKLSSTFADYNVGEKIYIYADAPSGRFGAVRLDWESSSGKFEKLNDYTIALIPDNQDQIQVEVKVSTDYAECRTSEKIILNKKLTPLPRIPKFDLGYCDLKSSRIDNVCKANLTDVVRRFQYQNGKKLIITSKDVKTAENAKKALTTGELGIKIDSYRVEINTEPLTNNAHTLIFTLIY